MRLIAIYWVLAADRLNQAVHSKPEEAQFILKLSQDIEVARYENAFIYVPVEDWDKLLRLVPEEQRTVRAAPKMPEMKKLELSTPFVPKSAGPVHEA
jgi:hypothetical protein